MKKRLIAACVASMILMLFAGCKEKKEITVSPLTMHKEIQEEGIFTDNNVVDLGNGMIACYVPNDRGMESDFGPDPNRRVGYYIAIMTADLDMAPEAYYEIASDHDSIGSIYSPNELQYLPDIYGTIKEMRMEDSGKLYIRYEDLTSGNMEEVSIPICFPSRIEGELIVIDDAGTYEENGRTYTHRKRIKSDQEGLLSGEEVFPITAWVESFSFEGQSYEIILERITPLYVYFVEHGWYSGGVYADYCLKVKDGNGDVVSEQILISYPAAMEEEHWLVDFSGDGFMDLAFCTAVFIGRESWSISVVLIWNLEIGRYEETPIARSWDLPYWNEEQSVLISWNDPFSNSEDDYFESFKTMWTFADGEWKLVGKLDHHLDILEIQGEEFYDYTYRERIYAEDGSVAEEILSTPEGTIWDWKYEGMLKLYD